MTEPIEPEFIAAMNALAEVLDTTFNRGAAPGERTVGFVLLTFKFGDEGRVNYISNAEREGVVTAMKSFLARAESPSPH